MLESKFCLKEQLYISNRSQSKLENFKGCHTTMDNREVARNADMLVLSIKPQMYKEILEEIGNELKEKSLLISIAPNWTLASLQTYCPNAKIARCMPNTPAMVLEGMTGFVCNSKCTNQDKDCLQSFLQSFGQAIEVEEKHMEAVVALSGSSPAYAFSFLDAMIEKGMEFGLSLEQSKLLAAQSLKGAAQQVLESKDSASVLKEKVCSPGGTTIEAIHVFEQNNFEGIIQEAMEACKNKAGSMKV